MMGLDTFAFMPGAILAGESAANASVLVSDAFWPKVFIEKWPKWRPEWSNLSQVEWLLSLVLHVFG